MEDEGIRVNNELGEGAESAEPDGEIFGANKMAQVFFSDPFFRHF